MMIKYIAGIKHLLRQKIIIILIVVELEVCYISVTRANEKS